MDKIFEVPGLKEVRALRTRIALLGANETEYAEAIEATERLEALLRNRQELEECLKRFVNADSFRMGEPIPYPEAPFGRTSDRIDAARKLLEKGNE